MDKAQGRTLNVKVRNNIVGHIPQMRMFYAFTTFYYTQTKRNNDEGIMIQNIATVILILQLIMHNDSIKHSVIIIIDGQLDSKLPSQHHRGTYPIFSACNN